MCCILEPMEVYMKQELTERIRIAIDESGKSMSAIAREIGVTPQAVRAYKEGISNPSMEKLDALARATGKSSEWMHLGIGSKENEQTGIVSVPLLEVNASAGNGYINFSEQVVRRVDFYEEWLKQNVRYTKGSNLDLISASGDSMEPTINSGDILLVDHGINEVLYDSIYVAMVNGELYVKRFQKTPSRTLLMISDNKKYQSFELKPEDDVRIIGRVVYYWTGGML